MRTHALALAARTCDHDSFFVVELLRHHFEPIAIKEALHHAVTNANGVRGPNLVDVHLRFYRALLDATKRRIGVAPDARAAVLESMTETLQSVWCETAARTGPSNRAPLKRAGVVWRAGDS